MIRVGHRRIYLRWRALSWLAPFIAAWWFLVGVAASSIVGDTWWLLVLWLGPFAALGARSVVWVLVELGVLKVRMPLWSAAELERREREAGF